MPLPIGVSTVAEDTPTARRWRDNFAVVDIFYTTMNVKVSCGHLPN
jgi:hypothetical protein